jgi:predicted  nucleic acid-binding Zn-ribbon protein
MAIEKNNESLEEQIIAQDTNVEMEADASEEPLVEIDQDGNAVEVTEEEA